MISINGYSQGEQVKNKNKIQLSTTFEFSKIDFFHNIQLNTTLFDVLAVESSKGVNFIKTKFQRSDFQTPLIITLVIGLIHEI